LLAAEVEAVEVAALMVAEEEDFRVAAVVAWAAEDTLVAIEEERTGADIVPEHLGWRHEQHLEQ